MDNIGFTIGLIQAGKIVTTADDVYVFEIMPGNRDWVTIIKYMSIEGALLGSLFLIQGLVQMVQYVI